MFRTALTVFLFLVAWICAPLSSAAPPAVTSPGVFLVSTKLAGNGQPFQCTAGFVVHDGQAQRY